MDCFTICRTGSEASAEYTKADDETENIEPIPSNISVKIEESRTSDECAKSNDYIEAKNIKPIPSNVSIRLEESNTSTKYAKTNEKGEANNIKPHNIPTHPDFKEKTELAKYRVSKQAMILQILSDRLNKLAKAKEVNRQSPVDATKTCCAECAKSNIGSKSTKCKLISSNCPIRNEESDAFAEFTKTIDDDEIKKIMPFTSDISIPNKIEEHSKPTSALTKYGHGQSMKSMILQILSDQLSKLPITKDVKSEKPEDATKTLGAEYAKSNDDSEVPKEIPIKIEKSDASAEYVKTDEDDEVNKSTPNPSNIPNRIEEDSKPKSGLTSYVISMLVQIFSGMLNKLATANEVERQSPEDEAKTYCAEDVKSSEAGDVKRVKSIPSYFRIRVEESDASAEYAKSSDADGAKKTKLYPNRMPTIIEEPDADTSTEYAKTHDDVEVKKTTSFIYNLPIRIEELAKPKIYPDSKQQSGLTKYGVSKKALELKVLSDRLNKLAAAKEIKSPSPQDATKTCCTALRVTNYKPSDRIVELAQPKTVTEKYKPNKAK